MSDPKPNSSSSTLLIANEKKVPPLTERKGNKLVYPFTLLKEYISSFPAGGWRRRMCLLLHIVLVLFHISLLVVGRYKQEQNVTFDIQDTFVTLTARLSFVLQAFVTIYTTILVAMLQSLSLRNELGRFQTLTATSDKTRSWSGLGSAVYILWQQLFVYASKGTLAIAAYLALITVLHNTTPALIGLELFNATAEAHAPTIGGFPNLGDNFTRSITNTASLISFLGTASNLTYPGLYNNTLHEILQKPEVGTAAVNASTFEVSCGVINNLNNPAPFSVTGLGYWALDALENYRADLIPKGALRAGLLFENGRCFLYASTNVTDSEGSAGPQFSLSPPMRYLDGSTSVYHEVDKLSVFGCSLSRFSQIAVIDAATNLVISVEKPSWKNSSKWQEWKDPTEKTEFWTHMVYQSPEAKSMPPLNCLNCSHPTLVDEYLMSKTGLLVKNGTDRSLTLKSLLLHDVENVLARLTAAAVWAAAQFDSPPGTVGETLFSRGSTTVQKPIIRARFKMNMAIVAIGMGASSIQAVLAFFLSRTGGTNETAVGTIGVLELLWVFKNRRETLELMDEVDEPTIDNLRKAGLVKMRLVDGVKSTYVECPNTDTTS